MFITEPNTPPASGDTTPEDPAAAMIAGLEAAGTTVADDTALPATPPAAEGGEDEGGDPPATPPAGDGTTPPADPAATPPADGATPPAAAGDGAAGKPAGDSKPDGEGAKTPNEAVEKEIKDLGIKSERTQARFRELSEQVATAAPVMAALKEAKIEVADLPRVIQRAATADTMLDQIMGTGASPAQYGQTLDYLTLVNRAAAGDEAAAEQAWSLLMEESKALAAALGRELPGVFDPLTQYPDLQQKVIDGMPREAALETARLRTREQIGRNAAEQERARGAATAAQQQAIDEGRQALAQWDASKAADPGYAALRPALDAKVAQIRQTLPPQYWVAATENVYAALKAQAAAAAPPAAPAAPTRPPVGPVRPGPARVPALDPATFDNPTDALMAGIAAATPGA